METKKPKEIVVNRNEYGFPKAEIKPAKEWQPLNAEQIAEDAKERETRKYWNELMGDW